MDEDSMTSLASLRTTYDLLLVVNNNARRREEVAQWVRGLQGEEGKAGYP
jgi:hypothetical protein